MNKKTYIKVFEEIFEVEEGMLNEEFTFEKLISGIHLPTFH